MDNVLNISYDQCVEHAQFRVAYNNQIRGMWNSSFILGVEEVVE